MDEHALTFQGVTLSPQKEMVRIFYKEMWDHADKSLIPAIFHSDFTFRRSLGPSLIGHDQFAGYVDWVTAAFGNYTTDILSLIEEGNFVSGKMRFHGYHRREMFGVSPSGKHVWWTGISETRRRHVAEGQTLGSGNPMRLAVILLALLTVAACGGQQAIDASRFKMSVDAAETYKSAKIGLDRPF